MFSRAALIVAIASFFANPPHAWGETSSNMEIAETDPTHEIVDVLLNRAWTLANDVRRQHQIRGLGLWILLGPLLAVAQLPGAIDLLRRGAVGFWCVSQFALTTIILAMGTLMWAGLPRFSAQWSLLLAITVFQVFLAAYVATRSAVSRGH